MAATSDEDVLEGVAAGDVGDEAEFEQMHMEMYGAHSHGHTRGQGQGQRDAESTLIELHGGHRRTHDMHQRRSRCTSSARMRCACMRRRRSSAWVCQGI